MPKERTKLITEAEKTLLKILFYERGDKCEICGRKDSRLGLFHILPKGRYPRIRFSKNNLLIAGWFCCHYVFHHDFYIARDRIVPRIKELRGETYESDLQALDLMAPPINMTYLKVLVRALKKELKTLEKGWIYGKV